MSSNTRRWSYRHWAVIMTSAQLLILTASLLPLSTLAQGCDPGWFGSSCQYKCHCPGAQCDTDGHCTNGTACQTGWFGPSCQYVDLTLDGTVTSNPSTTGVGVLTDGDQTTCLTDPTLQSVTVTWSTPYPFTWLRLFASNEDVLHKITVQFSNGTSSTTVDCINRQNAAISETALDIHCDLSLTISQVILTGEGIKALCSLYISGGRNVALRQNATQTSTYPAWTADRAVDGNLGFGSGYQLEFCSHTTGTDPSPSWTVILTEEHFINRYDLYSRIDCCGERLQGFVLTSLGPNNDVVFSYTDTTSEVSYVYSVTSVIDTQPVVSVWVNATKADANYGVPILTLCEVELYGDSVCASGKYGRECEKDCNCAILSEACFVSTGGCPSGCAAGFYGEDCQTECPPTRYGISCRVKCSISCTDQLCKRATGKCLQCIPGKSGDQCERDCPKGMYGQDCSETCSEHCVGGAMCNPANGSCLHGCQSGYTSAQCNTKCPPTRYGISCREKCSSSCTDQLCDGVTGNCLQCIPGKSGDQCEKDCPKGTYGQDCSETCSEHCVGGAMCHPANGSCLHGCESGYTSAQCNTKCPDKTYGPGCNMSCNVKCKVNGTVAPAVCGQVTGHCLLGCVNDTAGDECHEWSEGEDDVGLIAGVVVAILVIIALVGIIVIILWRKRRRFTNEQGYVNDYFQKQEEVELPEIPQSPVSSTEGKTRKDIQGHLHDISLEKISKAILVTDLDNFMSNHGAEFFKTQFENVPAINVQLSMSIGLSVANRHKNRSRKISAYDHSRVHLKTSKGSEVDDYINASYIQGHDKKGKFVASEGPSKINKNDFVRMLWQLRPDKVVMLTNLTEDGKPKCEKYWPEDDVTKFDGITVELKATHVFSHFIVRKLALKKENKPAHHLSQFHFTSWPDGSVPTNPWSLVDFQQRVWRHPTSKPIVVHGSAGSGRTGTFIALCHVLREAEDKGTMDFYSTLVKLRNDRPCMIQNVEQYMFLHKAANVAMICLGISLATNNTDTSGKLQIGPIQLESEFAAISKASADSYNSTVGQNATRKTKIERTEAARNKLKNGAKNILPNDICRPHLTRATNESEDYINAVLLPSFRKKDNQILTQLPMPGTILDFWYLVTQYQVSLIVAFEVPIKDNDETIGDYLPANEITPLSLGPFDIETGPITATNLWEEQHLGIFTKSQFKDVPDAAVTHLKCKSTNMDVNTLIEIVEHIGAQKSSDDGMVLYMCRDGAFYSGLVCVLVLLLDRIDNDHCRTVPLVVGAVKSIRPQVIPTLEQYKLLYEMLDRYNPRDGHYLNFGDVLPETTSHSVPDPTYYDYQCTTGAGDHIYETVNDN